jgi:alkylhydroperoxidase family enzyme
MALVPLVSEADADPSDASALGAGKAAYGQLLNAWRVVANRPGMFPTYLPFLRTIAGPGVLRQDIKELTAVRTTVLNRCRYTASHRCASAKSQGVTDAHLAAVAAGDFSGFDEALQVALELCDQLSGIAAVPTAESETGVDAALLERAQALFDPAQLVELTMGIAMWNAVCRFHRPMGLELDMPVAPPGVTAHL